jgi:phage terminase small subunit
MAKKPLNPKQVEFCKHYAQGLPPAEAYSKAFPNAGKGSSAVNASRLLKDDRITAKIAEFQTLAKAITENAAQKAADKVAELEVVSVAERMHILSQIALGKIILQKPMVVNKQVQLIECVPDYMDRRNAIAELNKMDGSYKEHNSQKAVKITVKKA